jgi:hypothetical protein
MTDLVLVFFDEAVNVVGNIARKVRDDELLGAYLLTWNLKRRVVLEQFFDCI